MSIAAAHRLPALTRFLLLSVGLFVAGCQPTNKLESNRRFVPSQQLASRALESALTNWQKQQPIAPLASGERVILIDARHGNGDRLTEFSVVGTQPWERGRRFVVELSVGDDATQRERFVVVGIDPLLVFRQEDFDMLANWMHPMNDEGVEPREPDQP